MVATERICILLLFVDSGYGKDIFCYYLFVDGGNLKGTAAILDGSILKETQPVLTA